MYASHLHISVNKRTKNTQKYISRRTIWFNYMIANSVGCNAPFCSSPESERHWPYKSCDCAKKEHLWKVRGQPFIAESRWLAKSHGSRCFSELLRFSHCNHISAIAPYSYITIRYCSPYRIFCVWLVCGLRTRKIGVVSSTANFSITFTSIYHSKGCVVSGFRCEVDENCAFLCY